MTVLPLCLGVVLAAAPPAARALELAKAKQWDELYLQFATAKPEAYPRGDQARLAEALAQGCAALLPADAVLAQSLGAKSAEFGAGGDGVLCAARAGLESEQRSAAEESLREGAARLPKDARLPLELGRLLLEDNDGLGAVAALEQVPKGAAQHKEAQALLVTAKRLVHDARDEERQATPAPGGRGGGSTGSSGGWESSVDDEGRRMRGNGHFRFRYFNGKRDFGQRAEYEGRVQAALEDARVTVQRLLGETRETPLDVILYSRQEFALHHGAQAAAAVAGFYGQNAIRMNDSAEMTPEVQTTLVHEYTHAVFDELASFNAHALPVWLNEGLAEYTAWRSQGSDHAPADRQTALRALAQRNELPTLGQLSQGPLVGQANPALLYALSASAVKLMVTKAGLPRVLALLREVGHGAPFVKGFVSCVGEDLARFDEELRAELSSR